MNRRTQTNQEGLAADAQNIWDAGIASVNATHRARNFVRATATHLCIGDGSLSQSVQIAHSEYRNLIVVGAGKAVAEMALGMEQSLGDDFLIHKTVAGILNVPDDKVLRLEKFKSIQIVGCRPAGVNLPTQRVLDSTANLISLVRNCHRDDLILFLVAGGGSALLEQPLPPISLDDFRAVTTMLSQRGAAIEELNAVRRAISAVKGGGLARLANCRRLITLVISDVLGDPLSVIASGPTVPDPVGVETRRATAMTVLTHFDPGLKLIPRSVIEVLQRPPQHPSNEPAQHQKTIEHFIIANNEAAVAAARQHAVELGYRCESETDYSNDTAEVVARRLIKKMNDLIAADCGRDPSAKIAFISGGEPTVQMCGSPGLGGRNQQLILAAMQAVLQNAANQSSDFCLLSGGTDGEDGNVAVAGGMFDSQLLPSMASATNRNRIDQHLKTNDAFPLLEDFNCLLRRPSTATNVCDLRVLLIFAGDQLGVPRIR